MAAFPALFGLLMATLVTGQVDISPPEAVRRVGDELEVLCKVPYPIESCRMTVGGQSYIVRPGSTDGDVIYYGQGFQSGECGAHIRNIRQEWNGEVICQLPPLSGPIEVKGTMRLMIAMPPLDPVLISPLQPNFVEGELFKAQCLVEKGRPAAKITWFLDDLDLLNGIHDPELTTDPTSDLTTISQNITRAMVADDNGRTLVCRAEHQALGQPREARRQLIVQYAPKVESNSITIFGLQLNAEGRLDVTVRSNPPPRAEWSLPEQTLVAPQRSDDGLVSALEPMDVGRGYYNVTLVLSQVKKEDVEKTYYLKISNSLGDETVALRISTMEEPAGLALETGAIVGIVIAVLVLLIAISLVVFAFATDRWCFAGRRRDNPKSSGESDTESAVGGKERSRLSQLSARLRAALPRKDKVQGSELAPVEQDKPADDKVVYATLALSEHTPADKPPPAFAEYAEIVYTDQQKEAKDDKLDQPT